MGKASTNKKVARAAGTGGGRTNRSATPWTFFGLIALIAVVGLALTFSSRNRFEQAQNAATDANATVAPTVGGTPWYEGYGVYECGAFVPAIKDPTNALGLTTPGDGVIHIAPKVKAAAGKNATLGEFAKAVGMTLSANQLQVPGGKKYQAGDDCNGKASKIYVKQYAFVGAVGVLSTQDPKSVRLVDDGLVTIAFVPPADKGSIPAPPAAALAALKKITTPATTTTTTHTTVPAASTATTTAGSSSTATTTAPSKSTATTASKGTSSKSTATTLSKGTSSTSSAG
jgi:hypothetical protein